MSFAITRDPRPFQQLISSDNLQIPALSLSLIPIFPAGSLDYNPIDQNVYVSTGTMWKAIGGTFITNLTITNQVVSNLTILNKITYISANPPSQPFGDVTADGIIGNLTFNSLDQEPGSTSTATITSFYIGANSYISLTIQEYSGTYSTDGVPFFTVGNVSPGNFILNLINLGNTPLSGQVVVAFRVDN